MSLLVRPSMNQPDDLDPLLRRFFQSELPSPWPTCPTPAQPARVLVPEKPAASWLELSQRFASRLALALSLLLFLGAAWGLAELFKSPGSHRGTGVGTGEVIEFGPGTAEHRKQPQGHPNRVQPKDAPMNALPEIPDLFPER